jgi:hypothetical protein
MARRVYRKVCFDLALIGEEVCHGGSVDEFMNEPARRDRLGVLVPRDEDVQWYPAIGW